MSSPIISLRKIPSLSVVQNGNSTNSYSKTNKECQYTLSHPRSPKNHFASNKKFKTFNHSLEKNDKLQTVCCSDDKIIDLENKLHNREKENQKLNTELKYYKAECAKLHLTIKRLQEQIQFNRMENESNADNDCKLSLPLTPKYCKTPKIMANPISPINQFNGNGIFVISSLF